MISLGLLCLGAALLALPLIKIALKQYRIWSCWLQLPHSPRAFTSLAGDVFEHHHSTCYKTHTAWSRLGKVVGLRLGPIPVSKREWTLDPRQRSFPSNRLAGCLGC